MSPLRGLWWLSTRPLIFGGHIKKLSGFEWSWTLAPTVYSEATRILNYFQTELLSKIPPEIFTVPKRNVMTLDNLYKVLESLKELEATPEKFDWGPSCEFARKRQQEAIKIVRAEILSMKQAASKP